MTGRVGENRGQPANDSMTAGGSPPRIAVDIGGTFTDVVLEHRDARFTAKVLTTPDAPDDAVIDGVRDVIAQSGVDASSVGLVIHGTTLATNAIIERKGALTALVTTEGFRDVLEIGYESRYDQYDIMIEKPVPLVPRERRLTVRERIDVTGRVIEPLDETGVASLLPEIERLGVQSVAIGFLHAYANPVHEQRTRELLAERFPELWMTLSCEVCPEVREYERLSTTAANAYVRPHMSQYLGRLSERLQGMGMRCPVLLMTSGGGLTTLETAMRFPIRLVESGPAGGAILASHIAAEMGLDRVISFDMGGTTAKICVIENFAPQSAREFEVDRAARFLKGSGLPLRMPVIEMVEIGAGGGSIARVDAMQRIAVGPDSAGADPGPAAYDRGGEEPTITDADITLGRIDPGRFAGGKVPLAPSRAEQAIERRIGSVLGLDVQIAAYGITEMVDETMANAARVHAVERGRVAAEHTLIAFGGAAPLHVGRLAEKLGISRVVVPTDAGVGSAIGFLRAPVAYELVRSRNVRLADFDIAAINRLIHDMSVEARTVVEAGAAGATLVETRGAYMRYLGQGHEIFVPLPVRKLGPADHEHLQDAYKREYESLYRRIIPGADVEALTWTVSVSTISEPPPRMQDAPAAGSAAPAGERSLVDPETSERIAVPLYWRPDLDPGVTLDGPAIIAEDETSTYVGRRFRALDSGQPQHRHRPKAGGTGMSGSDALKTIRMQIMWNRLIAVVEEQAQTLMRTAFSPIVRECGDLSAGVFDRQGRMLAQAITGTPGHVNSMAESVKHFIRHFPLDTMSEGDIYITNDPWMGTGHLNDFVLTTPCFRNRQLVGLFSCTSHLTDIGGLGTGPDGTDVHMEGVYIPMLKLADRGQINQTLMAMVRANTRQPVESEGDVYSLAACNDIGCVRLVEMMDEFDLDDLNQLADYICGNSNRALMAEIARIPAGTYRNTMVIDGYDQPVELVAALTIDDTGITVDYDGTSSMSRYGVNVPMAYTAAYTCFGLSCVVAPGVPNNAGSLAAFRITAPEGSILNAPYPAAVCIRHVVGQMLPDVVFGCLAQAVPERVPAEGASCLWNLTFRGETDRGGNQSAAPQFAITAVTNGGTGARPDQGRAVGHRLPERGARHPGRDQRVGRPAAVSAQGAAHRLRWTREAPRRPRPDHRAGKRDRRRRRAARRIRPHRSSRPRAGVWPSRRPRRGPPRRRRHAAGQGHSDDRGARASGDSHPRRWRIRRSGGARPRGGPGRRGARAGIGACGAGNLPAGGLKHG